MRDPLIVKVPTLLSLVRHQLPHQLKHDWKTEDTDLEATIREVLADPVAHAAYERARAERLRRPAIKTFYKAMRRYRRRATEQGLHQATDCINHARSREDADVESFRNNADGRRRLVKDTEWSENATHRERDYQRRIAFLYERAADAVAKLRVALAALECT